MPQRFAFPRATLSLLMTLALTGLACDAAYVTTAEIGPPRGTGGNGQAGSNGNGGASSGPTGAAGALSGGGTKPLPGDPSTVLAERPGRPHALQIHDRTLYWLRSPSAAEPAGLLERMSVDGGTVDLAFPASTLVRSFAMRNGEMFVGAASGGVTSYVGEIGTLRARWTDKIVAEQLVVGEGSLVRVRAISTPGETFLEICNPFDPTGCKQTDGAMYDLAGGFSHPHIGTLLPDGKSFYFSIRTADSEVSGLRRDALLVSPGTDERFVLTDQGPVRVHHRDTDGLIEVDAPPRTTGQPRSLFKRTALGLSTPASLAGTLYFGEQPSAGIPWRLIRSSFGGGEPTVLTEALCGADPQTPELVASSQEVFVACPGDGTVKRLSISP